MKQLKKKLRIANEEFPLASFVFVAGAILAIIAYIKGDLTVEAAYQSILYLGGGSAAVGFVRNQAGKGLHRHKNLNN